MSATLNADERAACLRSYLRGLSVDQIANGALYYGRVDRDVIAAAIQEDLADLRARETTEADARLRDLAARVRRYRNAPGVVFGLPSVLAEICRLLGFKNPCRDGRVYLTPTKIQRLGLPLTEEDHPNY